MPANTLPIYPIAPALNSVSLVGATALTTRTNIAGTTGLTQLSAATANGRRVDKIEIHGQGATVASILSLWAFDGTTSRLIDEIPISAVTPSNTAVAEADFKNYSNLVLPPNIQLYISQTVQTNVNVTLFGGDY